MVHTIAGLQPEFGGPARTVPALVAALAQAGAQVSLVTCESLPGKPAPLLPPRGLVDVCLLPHSCRSTRWLPRTNAFATVLRQRCEGERTAGPQDRGTTGPRPGGTVCVIHDHGLWLASNHAVAFAAQKINVPRIVSPRGMLTSWALQHRGLKKRFAWWLYQRRDLASAQVHHATSREEAKAFRAAGLSQPIAVIPNGVEMPSEMLKAEKLKAEIGSRKTVLFLGRIHPVKGLLDLVRAWGTLKAEMLKGEKGPRDYGTTRPRDAWRVVIAGNDENGHLEEVKAESRKQRVEMDFEFVGAVEGEARWDLYRSADLFVLPSHSENFGLVVAEALACGVPVITTRGTPWQDLETHRCGWWTEIGAEPVAGALRQAMGLTDRERREMGERGRKLVEAKYTWPRVAEQMKTVYEWMLGLGPKPGCVLDRP